MGIKKIFTNFKGEIVKAIIGLMVVFFIAKWDYILETFNAGENLQEQIDFKSNLKAALEDPQVVKQFIENPEFVKMFFESHIVQENIDDLGKELRNSIVEDVTRSDSNKVSMRSFVGKEVDIRDEQVLPLLAEIIKAWKDGKLMTEKDVEDLIKRRSRIAKF